MAGQPPTTYVTYVSFFRGISIHFLKEITILKNKFLPNNEIDIPF